IYKGGYQLDFKELKDSYDQLDSIEEHFKLEAGPGAGKTTFLANHVKRVLLESKRLKSTRKIACITYTNVGVQSLRERLGNTAHEVEVSTIHSFLYRHVLKPYFWLLDEWPFENNSIPTLFRQRLPGNYINDILKETGDLYLIYTYKIPRYNIRETLESAKWIKEKNEYVFKVYYHKRRYEVHDDNNQLKELRLKEKNIELYRKKCHEEGILLYEDVIYYSYVLLKKHPELQEIIRAKFPYMFVDEFQDTTSLQTDILKLLAKKEMIIGVIGDRAQSIYHFSGATVEDFIDWELPGIKKYYIAQNRRSHASIVKVLNGFKTKDELKQYPIRSKLGDNRPLILPGTLQEATIYCRGKWGKDLSVLGYNFDLTVESYNPNIKRLPFRNFLHFLSNDKKRGRKIRGTLKAIEAFKQLDYPKAMEKIKAIQKRDGEIDEIEALKYLEIIRKTYKEYLDKPVRKYYNNILYKQQLIEVPELSERGK